MINDIDMPLNEQETDAAPAAASVSDPFADVPPDLEALL